MVREKLSPLSPRGIIHLEDTSKLLLKILFVAGGVD
jgi:hypothetical protein